MDTAQPAPRMSVIVRTKNRPELLKEALASLRAQTFTDFETIVVNDGQPLPEGILAPAPGSGVRVVVPPPPGGRTRALNAGLSAARGEWIAYLDDDDLYEPDHLTLLDGARAAGARAAHTSVRQVRKEEARHGSWSDGAAMTTYDRPFNRDQVLFRNEVPLIALGHERMLAHEIGDFDVSFDLFEDWEFLIRLSRAVPVTHVPKVTAVYRVHEGSSVTSVVPWKSPEAQRARARVYAKHAALMTPEAQIAILDEMDLETQAALGRERFLVSEFGAVSERASELTQRCDALEGQLREAGARAARLEADLAAAREEATRFREESATREQALAAALAQRDATLEQIYRSRVWRLFTPWWKLKERLGR